MSDSSQNPTVEALERVLYLATRAVSATDHSGNDTMQIGEGNMFMVGSRTSSFMTCDCASEIDVWVDVESHTIGNFNVFQPRSQVSPLVNISNHCTVSAGTTLLPAEDLSVVLKTAITSTPSTSQSGGAISEVETLPPYTVVYGAEGLRRTWDQASLAGEEALRTKHIEYLREILPK